MELASILLQNSSLTRFDKIPQALCPEHGTEMSLEHEQVVHSCSTSPWKRCVGLFFQETVGGISPTVSGSCDSPECRQVATSDRSVRSDALVTSSFLLVTSIGKGGGFGALLRARAPSAAGPFALDRAHLVGLIFSSAVVKLSTWDAWTRRTRHETRIWGCRDRHHGECPGRILASMFCLPWLEDLQKANMFYI